MRDIFLSYARADVGRAERVARTLEAHGWTVWWDPEIRVGEEWPEVLERQLDSASCILVLWTDHSVQSKYVKAEARRGYDRGVLAQALFEPVKIPYLLADQQAADLTGWGAGSGGGFDLLLARIEELTGHRRSTEVFRFVLRNDGLARALLGGVVALAALLVAVASNRLVDQPWATIVVIGVLLLFTRRAWLAWRRSRDSRDLLLQPSFAAFLALFLATFAVAAGSDLVTWKRQLYGFDEAREGWKLPASFRDWRYTVAHRQPASDILVVDFADATPGNVSRLKLVSVLARAEQAGARAVAIDLYFPDSSDVDAILCSAVSSATSHGVPVIGGHVLDSAGPVPIRQRYARDLEACFAETDTPKGHLVGYREGDGKVRSLPTFVGRRETLPALSVSTARVLREDDLTLPDDGLLRVIPPSTDYIILTEGPEMPSTAFEGQLVLVGRLTDTDRVDTPDGDRFGTLVHADAIHSLLRNSYFTRPIPWLVMGILATCGYLIVLLVDRGASERSVLIIVGALSAGLLLFAAGAARYWSAWVDVEYALAGLWAMTPIVLLARRKLTKGLEPPTC